MVALRGFVLMINISKILSLTAITVFTSNSTAFYSSRWLYNCYLPKNSALDIFCFHNNSIWHQVGQGSNLSSHFSQQLSLTTTQSVARLASSVHLWPHTVLSEHTVHNVYFAFFFHLHWILISFNYIKLLDCKCIILPAHGNQRKPIIAGHF